MQVNLHSYAIHHHAIEARHSDKSSCVGGLTNFMFWGRIHHGPCVDSEVSKNPIPALNRTDVQT